MTGSSISITGWKALFTSFHMLYCLSQNSKYFLRYGRMTITVHLWKLSQGQFTPPCFPVSIFEEQ